MCCCNGGAGRLLIAYGASMAPMTLDGGRGDGGKISRGQLGGPGEQRPRPAAAMEAARMLWRCYDRHGCSTALRSGWETTRDHRGTTRVGKIGSEGVQGQLQAIGEQPGKGARKLQRKRREAGCNQHRTAGPQ